MSKQIKKRKAATPAVPGGTLPLGFTVHSLADGLQIWEGKLPGTLVWSEELFSQVWSLHPEQHHTVKIYGKPKLTPRWQQAYGANYRYTGSVNNALPIPKILAPLLLWSQRAFDQRLNGLLINWYQGPDHHIGPHRDKTTDLVEGTPIVTVSFGEQRTFRLEPAIRDDRPAVEFTTGQGTVLILPWETNRAWKHSVLSEPKRFRGRRISVTVRAFQRGLLPPEQYVV